MMLKAILFDLDGTLANTDPLHFEVWQEILRTYQIEMDHSSYKRQISGRQNPEIIQDFLPQLSPSETEELADYKEARFREMALNLQPLEGLMEILAWVEQQGLKKAVVTNAPRLNATFMLDVLQLSERFKTVVLGEEMVAGKPDPTPYTFCLNQLQIQPQEALVFEDSPSGIRSAVSAGIETIGVASTHEPKTLKELGASQVIDNFEDLQLWERVKSLISLE